jgi:hypothetical protein
MRFVREVRLLPKKRCEPWPGHLDREAVMSSRTAVLWFRRTSLPLSLPVHPREGDRPDCRVREREAGIRRRRCSSLPKQSTTSSSIPRVSSDRSHRPSPSRQSARGTLSETPVLFDRSRFFPTEVERRPGVRSVSRVLLKTFVSSRLLHTHSGRAVTFKALLR